MTFLNYKFANKLIATTVCTIVLSACGTTSKSTKNDDPFAATPEQQEQFSLAISAMRNNQHDDALAILTPLAAQTPTLSGPQLNIGLIYLHKEQFEQAKMAFEDAIYTRNSHYSYEIKDNKIRIYPSPNSAGPLEFWIQFFLDTRTPWAEESSTKTGVDGINNVNSLPFENTPYQKINSIGKQWIRRFSLSLCKETLGLVRGKFATIPIPGESVTLNGADLVAQAKDEQEKLREELKTVLDEMTYEKLVAQDASIAESVGKVQEKMPLGVYTG